MSTAARRPAPRLATHADVDVAVDLLEAQPEGPPVDAQWGESAAWALHVRVDEPSARVLVVDREDGSGLLAVGTGRVVAGLPRPGDPAGLVVVGDVAAVRGQEGEVAAAEVRADLGRWAADQGARTTVGALAPAPAAPLPEAEPLAAEPEALVPVAPEATDPSVQDVPVAVAPPADDHLPDPSSAPDVASDPSPVAPPAAAPPVEDVPVPPEPGGAGPRGDDGDLVHRPVGDEDPAGGSVRAGAGRLGAVAPAVRARPPHGHRFTRLRLGGYDTQEVDEFLDHVDGMEAAGSPVPVEEVEQAAFRLRRVRGYDEFEVDEELDRLVAHLRRPR